MQEVLSMMMGAAATLLMSVRLAIRTLRNDQQLLTVVPESRFEFKRNKEFIFSKKRYEYNGSHYFK